MVKFRHNDFHYNISRYIIESIKDLNLHVPLVPDESQSNCFSIFVTHAHLTQSQQKMGMILLSKVFQKMDLSKKMAVE